MDTEITELAQEVGLALLEREMMLVTAESCTGGGVAEAITTASGSSQWFERGFITYSNIAKTEMLGVSKYTLMTHGAVSMEIAAEMAGGALTHSHATVALAVTGVAGPGGGSPGKPVGTVCFAWCGVGQAPQTETRHFSGDREAVRRQSVIHSLIGLRALINTAN